MPMKTIHLPKQLFPILLIALILLSGTALFASPVFAVSCYDDNTGNYVGESPCAPGSSSVESGGGNAGGEITTFTDLLNRINTILNIIVPFLVGLGVFVIIYGVFGYIQHSADEEKRREAKLFVVWGVVGVFIMVSIWGFVSILVNTFPLKRSAPKVESVFPGAN